MSFFSESTAKIKGKIASLKAVIEKGKNKYDDLYSKGKKEYDKRQTLREKDDKREMDRMFKK